MIDFLTQHLNIRMLFAQHGLKPNEDCMSALLNVCTITGDNPQYVISKEQTEDATYSRHLLWWKLHEYGYSFAEIGRITGWSGGGVRKGVNRIIREMCTYPRVIEHTRVLSA